MIEILSPTLPVLLSRTILSSLVTPVQWWECCTFQRTPQKPPLKSASLHRDWRRYSTGCSKTLSPCRQGIIIARVIVQRSPRRTCNFTASFSPTCSMPPSDRQSRSNIPTPRPDIMGMVMIDVDRWQDSADSANWRKLGTSSAVTHPSSHMYYIMCSLIFFLSLIWPSFRGIHQSSSPIYPAHPTIMWPYDISIIPVCTLNFFFSCVQSNIHDNHNLYNVWCIWF